MLIASSGSSLSLRPWLSRCQVLDARHVYASCLVITTCLGGKCSHQSWAQTAGSQLPRDTLTKPRSSRALNTRLCAKTILPRRLSQEQSAGCSGLLFSRRLLPFPRPSGSKGTSAATAGREYAHHSGPICLHVCLDNSLTGPLHCTNLEDESDGLAVWGSGFKLLRKFWLFLVEQQTKPNTPKTEWRLSLLARFGAEFPECERHLLRITRVRTLQKKKNDRRTMSCTQVSMST